jgi:hypothetical protein
MHTRVSGDHIQRKLEISDINMKRPFSSMLDRWHTVSSLPSDVVHSVCTMKFILIITIKLFFIFLSSDMIFTSLLQHPIIQKLCASIESIIFHTFQ